MRRDNDDVRYLICDHRRLGDLKEFDAISDTHEEAKAIAVDMAKQYNCKVYILHIAECVKGVVTPQWQIFA